MKKAFKKMLAAFLAIAMCFTLGATDISEVHAAETSAYLNIGKDIWYGGANPGAFIQSSTDGTNYVIAYCLQPRNLTPKSGTYEFTKEITDSQTRNAFYYSYGGPGYSKYVATYGNIADGTTDMEYAYSHLIMSYLYAENISTNSKDNEASVFKNLSSTVVSSLKTTLQRMTSMAAPPDSYKCYLIKTASINGTAYEGQWVGVQVYPPTGKIQLYKSSGDTAITNGNSSYSLSGAKYGVYSGSTLVTTLTTNANGYAISGDINAGSYTVKETTASAGYKLDPTTYNVTVTGGETSTVYSTETPYKGYIEIYKKSDNPDITDGNSCYSLAGAEYGIFSTSGLIATLTTDANGYAKSSELPLGNYTVKELEPSKGYEIDTTSHSVTLTANQTATVTSYETPGNDPAAIEIIKVDSEGNAVQGGASLAGAQFTVKYYAGFYDKNTLPANATRTWVIETKEVEYSDGSKHYITYLEDEYKVSGDAFYYADNAIEPVIPLGTVTIEETKPAEGYKLEGGYLETPDGDKITGIYLTQVTKVGDVVTLVGGNQFTVPNVVKRGDFEFNKRDAETQKEMEGIPFKITSEATGESHVVYTDENGFYSSASEYTKHSYNTNKEEKGAGLWFGVNEAGETVPVDDTVGALPYGTYTIEELSCDANKHKILYSGTMTISRDNYTVDLGTIENEDIPVPAISTYAIDEASGTHYAKATDNVTIVDRVSYVDLTVDGTYSLKGIVMNKETGKAVTDASGKEVSAEKTFTTKTETGSVEMEFSFNASSLTGQDIVIFEYLYQNGKLITSHEDLTDTNQTISFPGIQTSAKDSESEINVAKADDAVTIIDTVTYKNLKENRTYTITGTLYDKETGAVYKDAKGNTVVASTTFKADQRNGSVDVTFTFDGSNLSNKGVVVFETLYYGNRELAEHKDITDEGQTVYFPEIGTNAIDKASGMSNALADNEVTITDTVSYKNLVPGHKYIVTGTLMDKETGKTLEVNGTSVTASAEFTPSEPDGQIAVDFTFDGTGLEGKTVVVYESLYVGSTEVAIHADIEDAAQTIYFPEIGTTATDTDNGTHTAMPDEEVVITDVVTYKNLVPGTEYSVKGTLYDKATKEALLVNGKEVTAETTFTADAADGSVELTFTFDGRGLKGKTVVAFESLYYEDVQIGIHADIEDEEQSIHFPDIATSVTDANNGTHTAYAGEDVELTDTVSYKNLVPGKEYRVSGILMDKATGEALLVNEKEVTAEAVFTPEEADGTVDVTFKFDATGLENSTIVVFETLYTGEYEIAVHADIEDLAQTIQFPEIGTSAIDSENETVMSDADKEATIVDTVNYKNLIPGIEYRLTGVLMDKATKEPLLVNDSLVIAEAVFTPEETDGSQEVIFTFDASGLSGKTLVVFETLYVNDYAIASHVDIEDVAQTIYLPKIGTTVQDSETGSRISYADEEVVLVDTVKYENLVAGLEYTLTGVLMDKETEEPVLVNGKEVVSETTFTPEETSGEAAVEFSFNASGLKGKTTVVFESLYINGFKVAAHADIDDEEQTIHFPEIRTTATDKEDGDHNVLADEEVIITDTVAYKNLIPGKEYRVFGILMDKATGKAIIANGKEVTAEAVFTAEKAEGTVAVEFKFDARGLGNTTAVVYETLYLGDSVIAVHDDLTDTNQTIDFEEPPKVIVQTGDSTGMYALIICAAGALVSAFWILLKRKRLA